MALEVGLMVFVDVPARPPFGDDEVARLMKFRIEIDQYPKRPGEDIDETQRLMASVAGQVS